MGLKISLQKSEIKKARQQFQANTDSAKLAIAGTIELMVADMFRKEKDPYGQPWKALSPATLARRRKRGANAKILQDTGRLKASFGTRIKGSFVYAGFGVEYAKTHQYGNGRVPARMLLPDKKMPPQWTAKFASVLEQAYKKPVK